MSCFCQSNRKCDECNEREKRLVWEEVEQVEAGIGFDKICKVLNFGNTKKVVGFFGIKTLFFGLALPRVKKLVASNHGEKNCPVKTKLL